jgi:hypothetical protein
MRPIGAMSDSELCRHPLPMPSTGAAGAASENGCCRPLHWWWLGVRQSEGAVNGARPANDAASITASAEMKWRRRDRRALGLYLDGDRLLRYQRLLPSMCSRLLSEGFVCAMATSRRSYSVTKDHRDRWQKC